MSKSSLMSKKILTKNQKRTLEVEKRILTKGQKANLITKKLKIKITPKGK